MCDYHFWVNKTKIFLLHYLYIRKHFTRFPFAVVWRFWYNNLQFETTKSGKWRFSNGLLQTIHGVCCLQFDTECSSFSIRTQGKFGFKTFLYILFYLIPKILPELCLFLFYCIYFQRDQKYAFLYALLIFLSLFAATIHIESNTHKDLTFLIIFIVFGKYYVNIH